MSSCQVTSDPEDTADSPVLDAFALKEQANELYGRGNVQGAITLWREALKMALKKSVREPSRELSDLQITLRLNLAKGFFDDEDYVMAKEHLSVVYENAPNNPKVYYRYAEIYLKLWDYDRARRIVSEGLEQFADSPALLSMAKKVAYEEKKYELELKQELRKRVNLKLDDERAQVEPHTIVPFDAAAYRDLLEDNLPDNSAPEEDQTQLDKFCHDLIDWRHDCERPIDKEVISDLDNWRQASEWNIPHNFHTLEHDRTAQYCSLPFSILAELENGLRWQPGRRASELLARQRAFKAKDGSDVGLPPLPEVAVTQPGGSRKLRRVIVEWLSRHRQQRPFTIHVLGARGDVEMESRWSAMLDRLPHIDTLQICMIGFTDADDPYQRRFKEDKGYLSPPLTKRTGLRGYQKFVTRLFKGSYSDFLGSVEVAALCKRRTGFIKGAGEEFLVVDETLKVPVHPVLMFDDHPLHPDLIVVPQPNFSRFFDSWMPDLAQIMFSNVPAMMLGYSVVEGEFASHDAPQMAAVLQRLAPNMLLPMTWSPFAFLIDPKTDGEQPPPPMPLIHPSTKAEVQYSGVSAKNAVALMFQGLSDKADKTHLAKLILSSTYVTEWRLKLSEEGIDVSREYEAVQAYLTDENMQAEMRERSARCDAKAHELKEKLSAKMRE